MAPAAHADIFFTLGGSNLNNIGPGPYGFMDLHRVDNTHVDFTFFGNFIAGPPSWQYAFTEMALNLNTAGFTNYGGNGFNQLTSSAVTFTSAPGVTKSSDPFNLSFSGNMDGFGNFDLHQNPKNPGADDAMVKASFELTRTAGTWLTEASVLNSSGNLVSDHLIVNGVDQTTTGFSINTSSTNCAPADCPVINPTGGGGAVPEPASIALLGVGVLGIGYVANRRRRA